MGNKTFGALVRKLRNDRDYTMEELAQKLDVTKSSISMWENSGVVPRENILLKLSKEFEVSIDYLLGNDNDYPNNVSDKLSYIQRGLKKLDNEKLEKAESILKTVFDDIFDDGDDDYDI